MYFNFFTGGRFWKLTRETEGTLKIGRKMLPPEGSHVWTSKIICNMHLTGFKHTPTAYIATLRHHDLIHRYGISVSQMTMVMYVPLVVNTSRSFPHSWLITGFVTRLTRRVPLVEQELLTLSEQPSSAPVFSEACVAWSLVLCVCFVLLYLIFWPLCHLFFFDLLILITPLVSSNHDKTCRASRI